MSFPLLYLIYQFCAGSRGKTMENLYFFSEMEYTATGKRGITPQQGRRTGRFPYL